MSPSVANSLNDFLWRVLCFKLQQRSAGRGHSTMAGGGGGGGSEAWRAQVHA